MTDTNNIATNANATATADRTNASIIDTDINRLLALDSLRLELVHELARRLHDADGVIQSYNRKCQLKKRNQGQMNCNDNGIVGDREVTHLDKDEAGSSYNDYVSNREESGSLSSASELASEEIASVIDLDTDDEIIKDFQKATSRTLDNNSNAESDYDEAKREGNSPSSSVPATATTSSQSPNINPLNLELQRALEL